MRFSAVFCILATTILLAGCQRNTAGLPQRPAAEIPPLMPGTPEDSARTVLLTLQADLRAVANADKDSEKKALAQLRYLAAEKELMQSLRRMPQYKALLGDDLIEGFIDNWAAIVSYYAEGYHFDRMRRVFESTSRINDVPTEVHIAVPASGTDDEAVIQVNCVYDETTDRWLIARIGFIVEPGSAPPPTAPPPTSPSAEPQPSTPPPLTPPPASQPTAAQPPDGEQLDGEQPDSEHE